MASKQNGDISNLTTIGVDIGKNVFHLVGFDADGKIALRQKIKRLALVPTFSRPSAPQATSESEYCQRKNVGRSVTSPPIR